MITLHNRIINDHNPNRSSHITREINEKLILLFENKVSI